MGEALDLAVVVTTFNNKRTIERCLRSVKGLAKDIYVVDTCGTNFMRESELATTLEKVWQYLDTPIDN